MQNRITPGDLRGLGTYTNAAQRSYSAQAALRVPNRQRGRRGCSRQKPRLPGRPASGVGLGKRLGGKPREHYSTAAQGPYDGTARYPRNPQHRLHRKFVGGVSRLDALELRASGLFWGKARAAVARILNDNGRRSSGGVHSDPLTMPASSANTGRSCSARSSASSRFAMPFAFRPPSLTP